LQDGVSYKRENLTQCQEQRLRSRHVKRRRIAREDLPFKDRGLDRANYLVERFGHSTLEASIIFHRDQVRVVLSEPWQHASVHLAIEVIHQKRAEERDVLLVAELIEQILEAHAAGYVPSLPKDVDHLAPPAHLRVAAGSAGPCDDLCG